MINIDEKIGLERQVQLIKKIQIIKDELEQLGLLCVIQVYISTCCSPKDNTLNVKEKSSCTDVFEIQCQDSSSRWVCVADLYPTTSIQSW